MNPTNTSIRSNGDNTSLSSTEQAESTNNTYILSNDKRVNASAPVEADHSRSVQRAIRFSSMDVPTLTESDTPIARMRDQVILNEWSSPDRIVELLSERLTTSASEQCNTITANDLNEFYDWHSLTEESQLYNTIKERLCPELVRWAARNNNDLRALTAILNICAFLPPIISKQVVENTLNAIISPQLNASDHVPSKTKQFQKKLNNELVKFISTQFNGLPVDTTNALLLSAQTTSALSLFAARLQSKILTRARQEGSDRLFEQFYANARMSAQLREQTTGTLAMRFARYPEVLPVDTPIQIENAAQRVVLEVCSSSANGERDHLSKNEIKAFNAAIKVVQACTLASSNRDEILSFVLDNDMTLPTPIYHAALFRLLEQSTALPDETTANLNQRVGRMATFFFKILTTEPLDEDQNGEMNYLGDTAAMGINMLDQQGYFDDQNFLAQASYFNVDQLQHAPFFQTNAPLQQVVEKISRLKGEI